MSGAWLLSLALLHACANPMNPPGGPRDETEPWLAAALPESAMVGVGPIRDLRFAFSEKMDRIDAYRWLNVYPKRTIDDTGWKGARVATVRLDAPLPPDTVVVVELLPGMKDMHGVPQPRGRTFPFATGDTLYDGEISGSLVIEDQPLGGAVVEIYADGPDTLEMIQRPVLRRAVADSAGFWRLPWLPADGHGWLLRAYDDRNGDRRAGDNEAQRIWPDTLRLVPDARVLDAGLRVLYKPDTPGELTGRLVDRPAIAGDVMAFLLKIADDDTGLVIEPQMTTATLAQAVPDTGDFALAKAGPGALRAVFFVDVDGDSLLSVVPTDVDTLWNLEPWAPTG